MAHEPLEMITAGVRHRRRAPYIKGGP